MNILRRLPLSRLLLLCGLVVVIGISATALASALSAPPKPEPKPLAQAIHDAMSGPAVQGFSARIQLTDHLLEGANIAAAAGQGNGGAGGILSSPLVTGGSGRLWIARNGDARLELAQEKGDTNIVWDGHTVTLYDAAANTVYRYTPEQHESGWTAYAPERKGDSTAGGGHQAPSVAKIEEAISRLQHVNLSGATPTDVGGQPAYTVRVSPKEGGSLIAGAELSFDAVHGTPLRAAVYSTQSATPVVELAASEVGYGPVESSVFQLTPPADAKVQELHFSHGAGAKKPTDSGGGGAGSKPSVTVHGSGITSVAVVQSTAGTSKAGSSTEGLPKVKINGVTADELRTDLGTILTFERAGARYLVAGALSPNAVEAIARGL